MPVRTREVRRTAVVRMFRGSAEAGWRAKGQRRGHSVRLNRRRGCSDGGRLCGYWGENEGAGGGRAVAAQGQRMARRTDGRNSYGTAVERRNDDAAIRSPQKDLV